MILGKHASIAGGIDKSLKRAAEIGCNSVQIFVKNPRGWKARVLSDAEVERFKINRKKYNINPVVVHAAYLINLASPKQELWEKSISALKMELSRSARLGAEYLIFHPGSHTGSGIDSGIKRIAEALNIIFSEIDDSLTEKTKILLENTAGAGSSIGQDFSELKAIIDKVEQSEKLGICIDSCHAFAAKYNLQQKSGLNKLLSDLDDDIGLSMLKVIHLNDSKHNCCENKDEHAHIGEGKIGENGFKELINHPKLKDLPFILETPWFEDEVDQDVILLEKLRY
ncbi:deoxyribonuclease IV [Halanaerobium hydrogeniformans]|uniref:Probable endonuclease 4 n=1 Tax=Halanaerobium hydrogeniformans TaxID=656519 RepID=E4RKS9_HALHG|nr:deoxyribonuclease IV [Halanaerobium hydrogeniformans]ADQ14749.1 apurinic endonuclease Apn1 [Halanaerobium hydrogeniformans]